MDQNDLLESILSAQLLSFAHLLQAEMRAKNPDKVLSKQDCLKLAAGLVQKTRPQVIKYLTK